ncbi:MAG: anti-sigma F factor [Christensenellaceae bacterium]|jgi:stage II sporulation protein AB (anti-sigma F factor)|nr:anti-sigma F factor [Christensenellaceae bacterium]
MENKMSLRISAKSQNESFARFVIAAFAASANPTIDEINDIKTAVSEAITNCVVHAYKRRQNQNDLITIDCELHNSSLTIKIADNGVGIPNVIQAMQPFFTTEHNGERSGMGFTVMQSFMDELSVQSTTNGTEVIMKKTFTEEENKQEAAGD